MQIYLVTYKSSTTARTEIACYAFLEREDEKSIRDVIRGWKILMHYTELDVGGSIFIGVVSILLIETRFILQYCLLLG